MLPRTRFIRRVVLFAFAVFLAAGTGARADLIAQYDFTGQPGNQAFQAPASVADGLTASNLTRTNVVRTQRADSFSANDWADNEPNYFGFTLSPTTIDGQPAQVTITSFDFGVFSTQTSAPSRIVELLAFTPDGTMIDLLGRDGFDPGQATTWHVDLLSNPFVFTEPVQFRIDAVNVTNNGTVFALTNQSGTPGVLVNGTVRPAAVPELASWLLLATIGSGAAGVRIARRRRCGGQSSAGDA